jgi:hypothetical protein
MKLLTICQFALGNVFHEAQFPNAAAHSDRLQSEIQQPLVFTLSTLNGHAHTKGTYLRSHHARNKARPQHQLHTLHNNSVEIVNDHNPQQQNSSSNKENRIREWQLPKSSVSSSSSQITHASERDGLVAQHEENVDLKRRLNGCEQEEGVQCAGAGYSGSGCCGAGLRYILRCALKLFVCGLGACILHSAYLSKISHGLIAMCSSLSKHEDAHSSPLRLTGTLAVSGTYRNEKNDETKRIKRTKGRSKNKNRNKGQGM